jgi:hypothetical protein
MNTYSTCRLKQVASRTRGRLPWDLVKLDKPRDVHVASLDGARETWYHRTIANKPSLTENVPGPTTNRRSSRF